jgi:uncharacterized protein YecE (DUF72 family)
MTEIRIGLCGFSMAQERYFGEYPVVEIQHTFYDPPADGVLRRWRATAPRHFEFTVKAWQVVTHDASSPTYRRIRRPLTPTERAEAGGFRTTPTVMSAWRRTLDCAALLSASAVLLQCPRSFEPTDSNVDGLRGFLADAERPPGLRLLWEPRGPWPPDLVAALCQELSLVHVVDPFVNETVTPDFIYYRLHGITGSRHVYTDDELRRLLDMIPGSSSAPAYVLFNNIPRVRDAPRFADLARTSPRVEVAPPAGDP